MKVYKFRSTSNLSYCLDILVKNRLFCANITTHSDLGSGSFDIEASLNTLPDDAAAFMQEVQAELKRIRVCSLAGSFNNSTLWERYAGGYDGVVFELDISCENLWQVEYVDNLIVQKESMNGLSPQEFTRIALSKKMDIWSSEGEYLIICPFEFYRLSNLVARVIVGSNVADSVVGAFYLIGKQLGVPVEKLEHAVDGRLSTRPVKSYVQLGYHGISTDA